MTTNQRLRSAAKYVVRPALRGRRLALMEVRNRVTLGGGVSAIRRFENTEVARLSASIPSLPEARIATIIPTYRRPGLLHDAVRSALAQSVRDHIVVVVDDGGGLPELPADPRLRAHSLSANIGVAGVVRNIGIRLTRSAYVAFLDDDNQWEPEHLEIGLAALNAGPPDQRPDLVYTAVTRCFADGRLLDVLSTPFDRRLLARHGYVDTNAFVARRCPRAFQSLAAVTERHTPRGFGSWYGASAVGILSCTSRSRRFAIW